MGKKNEKNNEQRAKIIGKGTLRVNCKRRSAGSPFQRKVVTNGVLHGWEFANEIGVDYSQITHILEGIKRVLRAGYEVRLGGEDNGIRLYPCLHTDFKTMFVAADTMGNFRNSVSDMEFEVIRYGEVTDVEKVHRASDNAKAESMLHVTPDKIVTCPVCGNEFRIGKVLV